MEDSNKRRKHNNISPSPLTTTAMDLLPSEIIQDILSRLPITSLVQFRCVCRSWRTLAADPHLTILSLSRHVSGGGDRCSSAAAEDPCLILHCDFPIRNQLYFADLAADGDEKHRVRRIQSPFWSAMPEFDVIGSCNGLLCLSDSLYGDALYVYNPFSGKHLELPKSSRYADQEVVFGFGFHPTTKQYKVIKIVYYRNAGSTRPGHPRSRRTVFPLSEVQILTLGSPEWRIQGRISHQLVRRPGEALVNGRIHWVTRPQRYNPVRRVVSFDLGDEQFREVAKPSSGGLSRCNFTLVAVKSCLAAAVYCNYGRLEIWVMKEYNVKESWVKEFSIGAYMPKGLKQNFEIRSYKIWRTGFNGRVRVLGFLKNGEILLEYKSRVLVCYDDKNGKFSDLKLQGLPKWFQANIVVGCLNWIDTPLY